MMPHDKLPPSLQTTLRKEEEENPPFSNRIWGFSPIPPPPNNLANCTKKLISQSALSLALALRERKAGGGSCIFCRVCLPPPSLPLQKDRSVHAFPFPAKLRIFFSLFRQGRMWRKKKQACLCKHASKHPNTFLGLIRHSPLSLNINNFWIYLF